MTQRDRPSTASIPPLQDAGVPHVVAAAELGVGYQYTKSVTLAGAGPYTLTFASLVSPSGKSVKPPIDADYLVMVTGNSAAKLDLTARTLTGFTLIGGSDGDVVAFAIVSRFGAMKR